MWSSELLPVKSWFFEMITALQMNFPSVTSIIFACDGNFSSVKFEELDKCPTLQFSLPRTSIKEIKRKTNVRRHISTRTNSTLHVRFFILSLFRLHTKTNEYKIGYSPECISDQLDSLIGFTGIYSGFTFSVFAFSLIGFFRKAKRKKHFPWMISKSKEKWRVAIWISWQLVVIFQPTKWITILKFTRNIRFDSQFTNFLQSSFGNDVVFCRTKILNSSNQTFFSDLFLNPFNRMFKQLPDSRVCAWLD